MLPKLDDARILIVDDNDTNIKLLDRMLIHQGYREIKGVIDSRLALETVTTWEPDIIILDIQMPHLDGFAVMAQLQPVLTQAFLPILVLTADVSTQTKRQALAAGAKDFLSKPIDAVEAMLRIRNLLTTRFLYQELAEQKRSLEDRVAERTRSLVMAQSEILDRLATAAEFRDDETGEHTRRVGRLAERLAIKAGMSATDALLLRKAAPLHDIGKIGVPDRILLKEGPLSREERREMERHVPIGAEILSGSHFPLLRSAEIVARFHHERWNGSGYPHGATGSQIPLEGRIVAIADVFDALTHARPYKSAWMVSEALAELHRNRGTFYDPRLVDLFVEMITEEGHLSRPGDQ